MSSQADSDNFDDLELLKSAAVHAGIIALGFFRTDLKTWTKSVASPVSEADIAVDGFLTNALMSQRPGYGWLSEETADTPERLDHSRVFIIDPIDGTRGFINGDDSWTISLAVVEDGKPVVGVVYAPVRNEMFTAVRGAGALLNGRRLFSEGARSGGARVIPAPPAVHNELAANGVEYQKGPAFPSLAYRLIKVATGDLDATVARRGAEDWDIAGADVILSEAGIELFDVCKGRPVYNRAQTRHAALMATADTSLATPLHDALRIVYGCPAEEGTVLEQNP